MTIENAQKDIIDNFLFFDDWTQKYEYIIELSKDLESMSKELKSEDNLIKGCQSKVWLHAELSDGKINFLAEGITKSKLLLFILFIKIKLYSAARISFLFGLIKFNDSLTILSCSFKCLESEPVAGDAASALPT